MESEHTPRSGNAYLIPASIILAGVMVSAAFSSRVRDTIPTTGDAPAQAQRALTDGTVNVRELSDDDFVRGNPNADVVIVEYSDFECPFCSQFHDTMRSIMNEFGPSGQVAWVYRHFPIEELHPNAFRIAMGAECVGELGGNDAFWTFTDTVYDAATPGTPFDLTLMSDIAETAGVTREAFNECMESGRTASKVQEDYDEVTSTGGGSGTPHNIVIAAGQQASVRGAQPLPAMREIVNGILTQLAQLESANAQ